MLAKSSYGNLVSERSFQPPLNIFPSSQGSHMRRTEPELKMNAALFTHSMRIQDRAGSRACYARALRPRMRYYQNPNSTQVNLLSTTSCQADVFNPPKVPGDAVAECWPRRRGLLRHQLLFSTGFEMEGR